MLGLPHPQLMALDSGVIVSVSVGQVGSQVLTSRQVQLNRFVDQAQRASGPQGRARLHAMSLLAIDSKEFSQEVDRALLEKAIFLESEAFDITRVKRVDIEGALQVVRERLAGVEAFEGLGATEQELRELVEIKLKAQEFVRFRTDSSLVLITDAEARAYFEANRNRFGDLPFSDFVENIKIALGAEHMQRRLADWFEVLKTKHEVQKTLPSF